MSTSLVGSMDQVWANNSDISLRHVFLDQRLHCCLLMTAILVYQKDDGNKYMQL